MNKLNWCIAHQAKKSDALMYCVSREVLENAGTCVVDWCSSDDIVSYPPAVGREWLVQNSDLWGHSGIGDHGRIGRNCQRHVSLPKGFLPGVRLLRLIEEAFSFGCAAVLTSAVVWGGMTLLTLLTLVTLLTLLTLLEHGTLGCHSD